MFGDDGRSRNTEKSTVKCEKMQSWSELLQTMSGHCVSVLPQPPGLPGPVTRSISSVTSSSS